MNTRITHRRIATIPQHLGRQRGASLLESIAYLGVAAIIILGAVALLSSAFGGAQSNRTTTELTSIRTAVRKLHMGQPYGVNDLNAMLITAKALPATLVVTGVGGIKNGFDGDVVVTGETTGTFSVTYDKVPQDVCVSVVSGANGWTDISATGTKVGAAIKTFPASPADAAALCQSEPLKLKFTSI